MRKDPGTTPDPEAKPDPEAAREGDVGADRRGGGGPHFGSVHGLGHGGLSTPTVS
jgi:hypothetical protein